MVSTDIFMAKYLTNRISRSMRQVLSADSKDVESRNLNMRQTGSVDQQIIPNKWNQKRSHIKRILEDHMYIWPASQFCKCVK